MIVSAHFVVGKHADETPSHDTGCVSFPGCVLLNTCVNMSGCHRRPISRCISEEVSIHTPVCGPITPAHHTLKYRHTDSVAPLIIETY